MNFPDDQFAPKPFFKKKQKELSSPKEIFENKINIDLESPFEEEPNFFPENIEWKKKRRPSSTNFDLKDSAEIQQYEKDPTPDPHESPEDQQISQSNTRSASNSDASNQAPPPANGPAEKKPRLRKKPQLKKVSYMQKVNKHEKADRGRKNFQKTQTDYVKKEEFGQQKKDAIGNGQVKLKKAFSTWDSEDIQKK